jgi:hypothetical protein
VSSIVISYRREDTPGTVGWMHELLVRNYGKSTVYRDIDQIDAAEDFRKSIGKALRKCDLVLAAIGPRWSGNLDAGRRRLDDPNDWVRVELETALQLGIPILPILMEGAAMPSPDELPDKLKELAFKQALRVDPLIHFHRDIEQLILAIDKLAPSGHAAPADAVMPAGELGNSRAGSNAASGRQVPPGAEPIPTAQQTPPRHTMGSLLRLVVLPIAINRSDRAAKQIVGMVLLLAYWLLILTLLVVIFSK